VGRGEKRGHQISCFFAKREMVIVALKKDVIEVWMETHDNLMIPTNMGLTTQQMCPQARDEVV
jgi:hypothetical protein